MPNPPPRNPLARISPRLSSVIRHSSFVILPLLMACSDSAPPSPVPTASAAEPSPAPPPAANPLAFTAPTLDGARFDLAARLARRRLVVFLFDPSAPSPPAGRDGVGAPAPPPPLNPPANGGRPEGGPPVGRATKGDGRGEAPPTPPSASSIENQKSKIENASAAILAAERLYRDRHAYNLDVIGLAVPPGYRVLAALRIPEKRPSPAELTELARKRLAGLGASFPCVVDPDGTITERYRLAWGLHKLDALPAFYAFESGATQPAGRPIFAEAATHSADAADYLHRRVLKQFGLEVNVDVDPLAGDRPLVPDVAVTDSRGARHRLRDFAGRPLVLVFIVRDCPRCKDELDLLTEMLAAYGDAAEGRGARDEGRGKETPGSPEGGRAPTPRQSKIENPKSKMALLVVCADLAGEPLAKLIAERGYAFPVGPDPDWALRSAFRYRGATPDTFLIAPDGRITFRHRGYTADLRSVLHMEIRALLGLPTRPLLSVEAYAGDHACRICHPTQFADWTLTRHACAWETLVRLGKETDPKCVPCHVTGMPLPAPSSLVVPPSGGSSLGVPPSGGSSGARGRSFARGFVSYPKSPHLAAVQCESCHGPNGCAAFAKAKAAIPDARFQPPDSGNTKAESPASSIRSAAIENQKSKIDHAACTGCHDAVHSPRFDFATYHPKILHNRAAELAALPRAEREARLRRLCSGARDDLFSPDAPYVGSAICARCHPTEAKALKDDPHARALAVLAKPAPDSPRTPSHIRGLVGRQRPECLRCHTTGYARPGGFPPAALSPATSNPEPGTASATVAVPPTPNPRHLTPNTASEGVGCEACHGPGKAHADDPKRPRAILRLGGSCPECNVLSICRQCHDDANSPDFDYRRDLPKARHAVGKAVAR